MSKEITHSAIDFQTHRCLDIGGSKIVAANVSSNGCIDELARFETPVDDFEQFCELTETLCGDDHASLSISVAGVIHPSSEVITSANVPCLSGRQLSRELSLRLNRDIYLINDANAFALAEARYGQAKDHDIVLAVILGTGIGGGIAINGQVLNGANGTAGEWGHGAASAVRTGVELPQLTCNCGQVACVDTLGGARGLERLYQHYTHSGVAEKDSHSIVNDWISQDPYAMRVVDIWLDVVGSALASAVNLLGNSVVAVGGGLANSKPLIEALDLEVRNRCLSDFPAPLLYRTISGPEQGLLGAFIHKMNQQQ